MQIVFFDYDIIPAAVEVIDRDRETGATLNAERHYIENCMPGETIYGSHYDKTDGGNPCLSCERANGFFEGSTRTESP